MRDAVFVDSGGWIALLSRRDGHHGEARALFEESAKGRRRLLTSDLVLAEVHRFLLFRAGPAPALAAVERIGKAARLSVAFVTPTLHESALDWLRRFADQPFTYTDAVSFAIMKSHETRLAITFDRHFEIAGFERWRRPSASAQRRTKR